MNKTLPKGWVEVNLKESVDFRKGKKTKVLSEEYFEGSVPYMDIQGLEKNIVSFYADSESGKYFKDNDVVIVWDGSRSGLILKPKSGAIGSTLGALSPYGYKSEYLYYFLLSQYEIINSKARGIGIPHVDPTYLWSLRLPLPPLPEQERIIAKLDKLIAQHEKIKKAVDRIPELLKAFRQQVLTQAVTGKLTEQWREGKDLEEWKTPLLKDVCFGFKYGSSSKSDDEGKVAVLRMGNLQNGKLDLSDLKYSNNIPEIQKYFLESGDVLFNRTNSPELVGKTSIYKGEIPAIYAGYLIKIENDRTVLDSDYLNFYMNTPQVRTWCNEVKSDGVSQSNINAKKLADLEIPLPSLQEQQEIVRRVESLFAKADAIEERYNTLKEKIDTLPQAILHKAFKGELVPQHPTDGDAKDLLKEIMILKKGTKTKTDSF